MILSPHCDKHSDKMFSLVRRLFQAMCHQANSASSIFVGRHQHRNMELCEASPSCICLLSSAAPSLSHSTLPGMLSTSLPDRNFAMLPVSSSMMPNCCAASLWLLPEVDKSSLQWLP